MRDKIEEPTRHKTGEVKLDLVIFFGVNVILEIFILKRTLHISPQILSWKFFHMLTYPDWLHFSTIWILTFSSNFFIATPSPLSNSQWCFMSGGFFNFIPHQILQVHNTILSNLYPCLNCSCPILLPQWISIKKLLPNCIFCTEKILKVTRSTTWDDKTSAQICRRILSQKIIIT
jgi:hypothetical protein